MRCPSRTGPRVTTSSSAPVSGGPGTFGPAILWPSGSRESKGLADVQTLTAEPDVVAAYADMAAVNPAFARFNGVSVDQDGNADQRDLHVAWVGAAHGSSSSRLDDPAAVASGRASSPRWLPPPNTPTSARTPSNRTIQ